MGDIARDPDLDRQKSDPRAVPETVTGDASEAAESKDGNAKAPPEPNGGTTEDGNGPAQQAP
ncbi:hypothetical protein P1X14_03770 [Sphingomonas sp. AOB5]|uniref:hypothetical protein n=1 Tax=Sphingomonas sp. AOB5 TaxID=3034017 RepID=UPI0023F84BC5|nr:hypothetical protein [Sphingomonas sp. AOB5]MDF7774353.1 hypothetical protein [Sphingomonas sp. AOB5]